MGIMVYSLDTYNPIRIVITCIATVDDIHLSLP